MAKIPAQTKYQQYVDELHKKISFPIKKLSEVVEEAVGSPIKNYEKVLKGVVNQVFTITTEQNHQLIARISRSEMPQFMQENWAIERCRVRGIPVPEIILIKHLLVGYFHYSICIQKRIDGDTLEKGIINIKDLENSQLKDLILQAGKVLSDIHSISTTGFGRINGKGIGDQNSFDELLQQVDYERERLLMLSENTKFPKKRMLEIIDTIVENAKKLSHLQPKLNHGDFGLNHLMVNNKKIVGILDFGEARSDTPIYDFAWWSYWYSDADWEKDGKIFEWLKEGYTHKELFTNDFVKILCVLKLSIGLEVFGWYAETAYTEGQETAKKRLIRDLELYKAKCSEN